MMHFKITVNTRTDSNSEHFIQCTVDLFTFFTIVSQFSHDGIRWFHFFHCTEKKELFQDGGSILHKLSVPSHGKMLENFHFFRDLHWTWKVVQEKLEKSICIKIIFTCDAIFSKPNDFNSSRLFFGGDAKACFGPSYSISPMQALRYRIKTHILEK